MHLNYRSFTGQKLYPWECQTSMIHKVSNPIPPGNPMVYKAGQFWKTKSLSEMTGAEWESLCDHCGVCCLHSVQDGKTGKVKHLAAACRYLDVSTCRCSIYKDRFKIEPDCEKLSPKKLGRIIKLPRTCAYRTIVEGRDLAWWHPLVSGDPATVHEAGISVRCRVVRAEHLNLNALEYFTSYR